MELTLTEEEKTKIKRRLDKHSPVWALDRLYDTFQLIDDLRIGKKKREDWFIPNILTNQEILEELYISNFI